MDTISVTASQSVSSCLEQVGVSARISSAEFTDELERQAARLFDSALYCAGLSGDSGDERDRVRQCMTAAHPRVLALLTDTSVTRMVVAYWDRLCRFGAHYLETLFVAQPRRGRSQSRTWRRMIRRA
jgi:predicted site-specific integrase-resolvase